MVGGTLINRFLTLRQQFGSEANARDSTPIVAPTVAAAANQDDILQRIENGDETALGELYDCYAPNLYRVLLAILHSPEDAEDALQEVFLRVAKGRMKRARDVRTYLHTCARHLALDILRRRKREQSWQESEAEHEVAALENRTDLQALMWHLPVEQREVIALKVWEEMTFAQIATIVRVSPNTVASRYRYGIEKLRGWLQEEDSE